VGWSDEQIAEAAYDAALFNLFVRLADTFGIEPPAIYEPDGVPSAQSERVGSKSLGKNSRRGRLSSGSPTDPGPPR